MKKVILATAIALTLGGCASFDFDGKTEIEKVDPKVDNEQVPTWYLEHDDSSYQVFAASTAVSDNMEFSVTKAMHQAKIILAEKVASRMTGTVKQFNSDKAKGGTSRSTQVTEQVTKSEFKDIDISGYTIEEKVMYKVNDMYRTYVLLSVQTADRDFGPPVVEMPVEVTTAEANRAAAALDSVQ